MMCRLAKVAEVLKRDRFKSSDGVARSVSTNHSSDVVGGSLKFDSHSSTETSVIATLRVGCEACGIRHNHTRAAKLHSG